MASTGFNTVAPTANSIPSLCAYQETKLFRLSHTSEPEALDKVYHSGLLCGVAFTYQHEAGSPPAPLDRIDSNIALFRSEIRHCRRLRLQ
jgi:hypothetical protein